jgi:glycosyltransferase involved in cell wall biosynthesis
MSVYNGAGYVHRALASLLAQTFQNFEVIVVDDGSSDNSLEIMRRFKDGRLTIVEQGNAGLTRSLNRALGMASGRWIARHDADDFSLCTRFESQVAYLEQHSEVRMLGTNCLIQPESHGIINEMYLYPEMHDEIVAAFASYNPFVHGSMMVDRHLLLENGGYNEQYRYVQDYELWSRLLPQTRVHNLSIPLYVRTVHSQSSQLQVDKQPIFEEIRETYLQKGGVHAQPASLKQIQSVGIYPIPFIHSEVNRLIAASFRRMGATSRENGLPWVKMVLQSLVYCPFPVTMKAPRQ